MLGLHEKGIDYRTQKAQPFETFRQWGVLQPTVSIDGAPWENESSRILVRLGYELISDEDLKAVRAAFWGVLNRFERPLYFYARFPARQRRRQRSFRPAFEVFYGFCCVLYECDAQFH